MAEDLFSSGPVLVVGLGRFGSAVATTLSSMGVELLAVDADAQRVQRHARNLAHVVQADASDSDALRQLGAHEFATAIVAIGADIEASVLITAELVDFGVQRVWAKAISDQHRRILLRVGAHRVFSPEREMGERVAHMVSGTVLEYLALDDGFVLAETIAPASMVGKALGDIGLRARHRITVVCSKHLGQGFTYAEASTVVQAGDLWVVAGTDHDVGRFVTLG